MESVHGLCLDDLEDSATIDTASPMRGHGDLLEGLRKKVDKQQLQQKVVVGSPHPRHSQHIHMEESQCA